MSDLATRIFRNWARRKAAMTIRLRATSVSPAEFGALVYAIKNPGVDPETLQGDSYIEARKDQDVEEAEIAKKHFDDVPLRSIGKLREGLLKMPIEALNRNKGGFTKLSKPHQEDFKLVIKAFTASVRFARAMKAAEAQLPRSADAPAAWQDSRARVNMMETFKNSEGKGPATLPLEEKIEILTEGVTRIAQDKELIEDLGATLFLQKIEFSKIFDFADGETISAEDAEVLVSKDQMRAVLIKERDKVQQRITQAARVDSNVWAPSSKTGFYFMFLSYVPDAAKIQQDITARVAQTALGILTEEFNKLLRSIDKRPHGVFVWTAIADDT